MSSCSRGNTDSTSPPQSLHARSSSTIQAASPAGESPSATAGVCGRVDCSGMYAPSVGVPGGQRGGDAAADVAAGDGVAFVPELGHRLGHDPRHVGSGRARS
ncbi:hypothetical protein [Modestobacter sp. SSW1-42]|uniref:hypothetical protein n=1 Tax=Modestobacter sp. SSW1-42 TaxID=596372 RepID=UPI00398747B0